MAEYSIRSLSCVEKTWEPHPSYPYCCHVAKAEHAWSGFTLWGTRQTWTISDSACTAASLSELASCLEYLEHTPFFCFCNDHPTERTREGSVQAVEW